MVVLEGIDVLIPGERIGILHGDISMVGHNQVDMILGVPEIGCILYTTSKRQV